LISGLCTKIEIHFGGSNWHNKNKGESVDRFFSQFIKDNIFLVNL